MSDYLGNALSEFKTKLCHSSALSSNKNWTSLYKSFVQNKLTFSCIDLMWIKTVKSLLISSKSFWRGKGQERLWEIRRKQGWNCGPRGSVQIFRQQSSAIKHKCYGKKVRFILPNDLTLFLRKAYFWQPSNNWGCLKWCSS